MKDIWYRKKWVSILLHGVFWMLFFIVPYLLQPSFQDHAPKLRPRADQDDFFLFNLLKCFFWMGFFYLNAYKLIPAFAYRKRYFLHFLCLLGMLGALSL